MKILTLEIGVVAATPANPIAGFVKVYQKSTDNHFYQLTSAGVETDLSLGSATAVVSSRIRRSTNQSIATGTTYIDLAFDTSAYQSNGTFWTSGATVTIPEAGYYQVFAEATFEGAAVAVTCDIQILVNGSLVIGDDQKMVAASATAPLQVIAQRLFAAGDTIKVQVKHSSATALNILTQGDHSPDIIFTKLTGAKGDPGIIDEPTMIAGETSVNNQPLFYTINKFETLQTNFYAGGVVALDTVLKAEGTGAMKLTLATTGPCGPRLTLPSAVSLLYKAMTIKCRSSAWANISSAEILFGTEAGMTNFYLWQWKGASNPKLVSPPDNEWIERTFNPGDCMVGAGAPNWGAITHIIIRAQASTGTPDFYVDDFKYFDSTQRPMVCISFDDSLATQYTAGLAKLDQYNINATFYMIWDLLGVSIYMTEANVVDLGNKGHDISGHGQANLTTLTQTQRIIDLRGMKKLLIRLGYNGKDLYALPNGVYNDAILADVRKYFSSIANIDYLSNTAEYAPTGLVNRFSPDAGTTTATIQSWIDNAIANNNMAVITWHGIVPSAATGAQVLQSTYNTIMDYIGTKKNAGILDTGSLSDYYAKPIITKKSKGQRVMEGYMPPELKLASLQESLFETQVGIWQPAHGSATVPALFGMAALTAVGTATVRNLATTNYFTRTKKLGYVSVATAGGLTGPRNASASMSVGSGGLGGFYNVIKFGCSDAATVAGARQFVGISATLTALTNVEPSTLLNCVGVGHGTADTNLRLYYGGSAAQTPIDLGAFFPANTLSVDMYELVLWAPSNDGNSVIYWEVTRLNTGHSAKGVLNGTIGTTRPATTTLLTNFQSMRTNNATALAVGLDIALIYTQTNF